MMIPKDKFPLRRRLIAYLVRAKRRNRGLTADSLARRAGYCARTISRIEQCLDTPTPNEFTLRDVFEALASAPIVDGALRRKK